MEASVRKRPRSAVVDVGAVDDFPEASARIVEARGLEIGVISWHGRLYALRNVCPHMGGPVCRGELLPRIVAPDDAPGRLDVEREIPVIACAWHSWEFDVRTGESLTPDNLRVRTYAVEVADGRVLVDLARGSRSHSVDEELDEEVAVDIHEDREASHDH
jgi:nitrite reductase (NADH) small subunit